MRSIWLDFRSAWRLALHSPFLSLASVFLLALGIAASTCAFSMLRAVLLRPLPYLDSDRLIRVDSQASREGHLLPVSIPDFADLQERVHSFDRLTAFRYRQFLYQDPEGILHRLPGLAASSNLFEVLGREARLGRTFQLQDDRPDAPPVAVVSDTFWRDFLGAERDLAARTIRLNGIEHRVIGVMPVEFKFPEWSEIWVNMTLDPQRAPRSDRVLRVLGRLRRDTTLKQASMELNSQARRLEFEYPKSNRDIGIHLVSLRDFYVADERPTLLLAMATSLLVLLIAACNVSGLLLVRNARRESQLATRATLGASPARLAQLLLIESATLALLASALGLWLADVALRFCLALIPVELPFWLKLELDSSVLLFAGLMVLVSCLATAYLPARAAFRLCLFESLKGKGKGFVGGARERASFRILTSAQGALAVLLLSLAFQSSLGFFKLQRRDLGFQTQDILTLRVSATPQVDAEDPISPRRWSRVLESIKQQSAAEAVALTTEFPLFRSTRMAPFEVRGFSEIRELSRLARIQLVSPEYFRLLGIPVLSGRDFESTDHDSSSPVAAVNSAFQRYFLPRETPLGRQVRVTPDGPSKAWRTIVGVVGDIGEYSLQETPKPTIYFPLAQSDEGAETYEMLLHSSRNPQELFDLARRETGRLDGRLVVDRCMALEDAVLLTYWQQRFFAVLFAALGGIALLLATLGMGAVVCQSVNSRHHEMAIRMTLGAGPAQVLYSVAGEALAFSFSGILCGLAASVPATRLARHFLLGLDGNPWLSLTGATMVLIAGFVLASLLPAQRILKQNLARTI